jgi:hypothetical protein
MFGGCGQEEATQGTEQPKVEGMSLEKFEQLYRGPSEDETYDDAYIVDGDILLTDRQELEAYYVKIRKTFEDVSAEDGETQFKTRSDELFINLRSGGAWDRWSKEEAQRLTYCVDKKFDNCVGCKAGSYQKVVDAMREATTQWSQAAAVRFMHVSARDAACEQRAGDNAPGTVLFYVKPNAHLPRAALAFFPSDNDEFRRISINWSKLEKSIEAPSRMTLRGILTHELGHVLGFRHEHLHNGTRPERNREGELIKEGVDWKRLPAAEQDSDASADGVTQKNYDPYSVMHYRNEGFDHGRFPPDYLLTPYDKQGAVIAYGPADVAGL